MDQMEVPAMGDFQYAAGMLKRELVAEAEQHFSRFVNRSQMDFLPEVSRSRGVFHVQEPCRTVANKKASESKHNVFYRQFRPMIVVLTVFGRIAVQKSSDGVYRWRWFSWLSLYCLVNYSLQTYLAVQIFRQRMQSVLSSDYDEFIFAIHILAYVQIHFHVPFTYWIQGPQYARYLNQWTEFEKNWFRVTGKELELKHNRISVLFVLIMLPFLVLLLALEEYSTLHDPYQLLLPYFINIGSTLSVLGTWYIACLEVGGIAKDLVQILIKTLQTNPDPKSLQGWRNLWLNLGSLVTDLGSKHFAIMASIFLTFSVTFLLGLYNALSHMIVGDFNLTTVGYLTASSMSILIIYIVCDSGHQATTQVQALTSQCVMKLQLPASRDDVRYEIDLILRIMQSDGPEIRLGGFVALNRPLFISFVANTMTYLIVILQFKR